MRSYTTPILSSSALLTIDMQNDFVLPGAIAEIAGTYDRIAYMRTVRQLMRSAGRPIIHVVRLYEQDGSNAELCRRSIIEGGKQIVAPGSDGAQIVSFLLSTESDEVLREVSLDAQLLLRGELQTLGEQEWAMYKPRWGAFYGTQLETFLRSQGVDTVIVIGCNFPNCPRTTVYEASERDFRIGLVRDAMSGVYDKGVDELRGIGVQVWSTEQFTAWAVEEQAADKTVT